LPPALAFNRCATAASDEALRRLGPAYAKRNGGYLRILKPVLGRETTPHGLVELLDRPAPKEDQSAEAKE